VKTISSWQDSGVREYQKILAGQLGIMILPPSELKASRHGAARLLHQAGRLLHRRTTTHIPDRHQHMLSWWVRMLPATRVPKESLASLTVKGFVAALSLRVDPKHVDYEGRPHLTFWKNMSAVMATTTEEVNEKSKAEWEKRRRTMTVFLLDMSICPALRINAATSAKCLRVPFVQRAPAGHAESSRSADSCYVSPMRLLLLTQTDVALTALVLSPVPPSPPSKGKDHQDTTMYRRLGLLEIGSSRTAPWIDTMDRPAVPADAFFKLNDYSSRRNITIVR
jgi:hypothetical protein